MDTPLNKEEWRLRTKLFKDWLENGGIETIWDAELLEDIGRVRLDSEDIMIPSTVRPIVNATIMALLNANLHPPPYSGKDQTSYGSLFNKSQFIASEQVDSEEQFDKLWDEHLGKTDHLYRGQREATWQLYTSGQRSWIGNRLHESENSYGDFLIRLVENARTAHDGILVKYLASIGMDPEVDMAVLSFLQHFGAPTPLQDWTWSFGNAVFFALEGLKMAGKTEADHYCSVYYIEEQGFSSAGLKDVFETVWKESSPELSARGRREFIDLGFISEADFDRVVDMEKADAGAKHRFALLFGREFVKVERLMSHANHWPITYFSDRDDLPGLSFSLNNSLNIQNQRGVFMFNTHEALPIEHVGIQLHEADHGKNDSYRFCRCWNVHRGLESHIRAKLNAAGIDKGFIYPDPSPMNFGVDPYMFGKGVYEQTREEGRARKI